VVASENGRRPAGVVSYEENDPADLCSKLEYVLANYAEVKAQLHPADMDDNVGRMADWLVGEGRTARRAEIAHAT
jgi:hypothetical protein